jgi:hypothetical protein
MPVGRLRTNPAALRLSDLDRERALGALRDHYAAGRLSIGELEARVEDVYRSSTRSDIAATLRDLPLRGRQLILRRVRSFQRAFLRMHLFTYATANASLVGIWELTGQGIFWPALFLMPSTALVAGHVAVSRMLTRALGRIR